MLLSARFGFGTQLCHYQPFQSPRDENNKASHGGECDGVKKKFVLLLYALPTRLELAISCSVGRRLTNWATGAPRKNGSTINIALTAPSRSRTAAQIRRAAFHSPPPPSLSFITKPSSRLLVRGKTNQKKTPGMASLLLADPPPAAALPIVTLKPGQLHDSCECFRVFIGFDRLASALNHYLMLYSSNALSRPPHLILRMHLYSCVIGVVKTRNNNTLVPTIAVMTIGRYADHYIMG